MLFLRKPADAPNELQVRVRLPIGKTFTYALPVIYSADYSLDEIFEKRLLMLLPFYIMRYEKDFSQIETDELRFHAFLLEIREICGRLEMEADESIRSNLRRDLIALIRKVSDHLFRNRTKLQKGVVDVMGGKVLELPSDKLKEAYAEGEAKGLALMGQLATYLVQDGQAELISVVSIDEKKRQEYLKKYGLI